MTDTNWKKLKNNLRGAAFSDAVIDALENETISALEAKAFLNSNNEAYCLILTKLEETLKDAFQKHTGIAYPEHVQDGMERVAYEAICSVFENDKDKYGPSFNMFIGETEILVATEQAVKELGLNPAELENTTLRLPAKTKSTELESPALD